MKNIVRISKTYIPAMLLIFFSIVFSAGETFAWIVVSGTSKQDIGISIQLADIPLLELQMELPEELDDEQPAELEAEPNPEEEEIPTELEDEPGSEEEIPTEPEDELEPEEEMPSEPQGQQASDEKSDG